MNAPSRRRLVMAGVALSLAWLPRAHAETPANEIVVTPYRVPTPASAAGQALTVIRRDEIEKWGATSVVDALRSVTGVAVTQNGGPAGLATIRLRGAEARHSMVLVDGLRVGDPSSTGGEFDLSFIDPNDVERIEILKGPQSALYGSEAIGGVVNIITRKGARTPRAALTLEGGSYGTRSARGSVSGGTAVTHYAFAASGFATDGFSSFGHDIRRIERGRTTPLERDSAEKASVSGRVGHDAGEGVALEAGFLHSVNANRYDDSWGDNAFARQRNRFSQLWGRAGLRSFDDRLQTGLKLHASRLDRYTGAISSGVARATDYAGHRFGFDLQNDLKLDAYGVLTFGVASETETAETTKEDLPRGSSTRTKSFEGDQTTLSAYLIHHWKPLNPLTLSLSGRVDSVVDADTFPTWRAGAAYAFAGTGTKLRTSLGTGAKIPSLYQRFSEYGTSTLRPEKSFGVDAGIDQTLMDDRVSLSGTVFFNRIDDLIDGQWTSGTAPAGCAASQIYGCYLNVARAETKGTELAGSVVLIPGTLRAKGTYTFLLAENRETGSALLRRPMHQGVISVTYLGIPKVEIEPRLTLVGHRMDYDGVLDANVRAAPYARLDLHARYTFDQTFSAFIRLENLTNAHYEDVRNYGTAGRAAYAGVKASW